jgi:hypothetical protein
MSAIVRKIYVYFSQSLREFYVWYFRFFFSAVGAGSLNIAMPFSLLMLFLCNFLLVVVFKCCSSLPHLWQWLWELNPGHMGGYSSPTPVLQALVQYFSHVLCKIRIPSADEGWILSITDID